MDDRNRPTARDKLNHAHLWAAGTIGAVLAVLSGAWVLLPVAMVIYLALAIGRGDVRLRPGRRPPRGRL